MPHLKHLKAIGVRTRVISGAAVAVLALVSIAAGHIGPGDINLPPGYRDWPLISVASLGSPLNDIRAKLGNPVAMRAFRDGKTPFPDGTIIVRLAWKHATSDESNTAFRRGDEGQLSPEAIEKFLAETFVAGPATNVQVMVKDSKKYASTGGWGFAQFTNDKPDTGALLKTCFPCHAPAKDHDFVFTRYAP